MKEFHLFLKIHDKFAIVKQMEYKVSFYYLERSLILTTTTLDLFDCLIGYQIGVNNTFAWVPQL